MVNSIANNWKTRLKKGIFFLLKQMDTEILENTEIKFEKHVSMEDNLGKCRKRYTRVKELKTTKKLQLNAKEKKQSSNFLSYYKAFRAPIR